MKNIAFTLNYEIDLSSLNFRLFNRWDWEAYSGCQSEFPLIAETENYTFVLDGNLIEGHVYTENGDITFVYNLTSEEFEIEPYEVRHD